MVSTDTGPKHVPSFELRRLSPKSRTWPSGTSISAKSRDCFVSTNQGSFRRLPLTKISPPWPENSSIWASCSLTVDENLATLAGNDLAWEADHSFDEVFWIGWIEDALWNVGALEDDDVAALGNLAIAVALLVHDNAVADEQCVDHRTGGDFVRLDEELAPE